MNPIKLELEDRLKRKDFGTVRILKHSRVIRKVLQNFLSKWPLKIGFFRYCSLFIEFYVKVVTLQFLVILLTTTTFKNLSFEDLFGVWGGWSCLFFFLIALYGMQNLSSPTRN